MWDLESRVVGRRASGAAKRCPSSSAAPFERPDEEITRLRRATGNRYRVLRRLGGGGMADVYVAEQAQLARRVVIKVLHPHLARDAEVAERFRREAEAAAKLVHPHICGILDYGATQDVVFTVMPFLEGGSLADAIQKTRFVDPARAARVAVQVACALDYAHRRGVVHRDVKPDNVLFDEDGNAVLTDFGIATARFHGRLTASGRAMGTPHYMSPEQAMGKLVDGRSDIYAVGILLVRVARRLSAVRRRGRVFGELQAGARGAGRAGRSELARPAGAVGDRDALPRQDAGDALRARLRSRRRAASRSSAAARRGAGAFAPSSARAPRDSSRQANMKIQHDISIVHTTHPFVIARGGTSEHRLHSRSHHRRRRRRRVGRGRAESVLRRNDRHRARCARAAHADRRGAAIRGRSRTSKRR